VKAMENACEQCPVPKPTMERMIAAAVPVQRVDVLYPTD
jgi:hypothetical protein